MEGHHLIYRVILSIAAIVVVDAVLWVYLRMRVRGQEQEQEQEQEQLQQQQQQVYPPKVNEVKRRREQGSYKQQEKTNAGFWNLLERILLRIHIPLSVVFGMVFFGYFWWKGLPGLDVQAYQDVYWLTGAFILIWMPRFFLLIGALFNWFIGLIVRKRLSFALPGSLFFLMSTLILYGIIWGKSDFQLREVDLGGKTELPEVSVVQFSDAHIGSFSCKKKARKGLELIGKQNADIIVFTGDLVNVVAEEAYPYKEDFTKLKAPLGKYAILGNHDIGDYLKGDTIRPPEENRQLLRQFFTETGFILLEDSAVMINTSDGQFALAGVDNWGLPPFRQEGDLQRALSFFPGSPTLLLSHDPTHWEAEILEHPEVELTLSGHTHGMQMGLRFGSWQWSPVKYKYERWAGLYEQQGQLLYVNTGFGFIGVPMRIGMRPEITMLRF